MTFIERYHNASKKFYLAILGLTIPAYLMLYGASGHEFYPETEDILWLTVATVAFTTSIAYFRLKPKEGLTFKALKILMTVTLLLTLIGGLKAFLLMVQFRYSDDTSLFIRGLSYIVPLLFCISALVIFLGMFVKNQNGEDQHGMQADSR